ncbi:pentatricopeptide repeat-containing protein [Tanacetum coccineum]
MSAHLSNELESCREPVAPVKRNDLLTVCKEGKLKEAIELLVKVRSGITGDVGLVHKMIDMYWNGLGDDGLEMYEQMRNNGLLPNEETFLAVLDCASADAIE